MLHNLEAEIGRKHIKKKEIASAICIDESSLWNKIHERTEFTWTEAQAIHDTFFPYTDMHYLFESDSE